ncbi:hypothetical protein GCM10028816_48260 [Spirosoma lituiforme]
MGNGHLCEGGLGNSQQAADQRDFHKVHYYIKLGLDELATAIRIYIGDESTYWLVGCVAWIVYPNLIFSKYAPA